MSPFTRKTFWDDPYQTQLQTQITSVNESQVTVAETIFYAFAGGQERDTGRIGSYPVLDAQKEGPQIHYKLPDDHKLHVGDAVQ